MSENKSLKRNPEISSAGGVVGRMDYFINCLIIFALGAVAFTPLFLGTWAILITLAAMVPVIYFHFINIFKRLRDIRGTTEGQKNFQIGLVISFALPVINVFAILSLLFMEGKITSKKSSPEDSTVPSPDSQKHNSQVDLNNLKIYDALTSAEKEEEIKKQDAKKRLFIFDAEK